MTAAIVRPSRPGDLDALYEMAKRAGGGFTNLPPDRGALEQRLARSAEAFAKPADVPGDDRYILVLEDVAGGRAIGTAQIFARVGESAPFYSYRLGTLTQTSRELGRTFRAEMLTLTTDLEGASEVGGLFLHPHARAGGLGGLLARSRYLFIALHRARFADRVIAELRGVVDEAGGSPFWDALAGRFFGMPYQAADEFNGVHGNQFIADLMPKHPIYLAMLSEHARAAIGLPHPGGRAAMRMLEREGFRYEGYVDIFDGGPTLAAPTDRIRSIREARTTTVAAADAAGGEQVLVALGRLSDFRCGYGVAAVAPDGLAIDAAAAAALGLTAGAAVLHVAR